MHGQVLALTGIALVAFSLRSAVGALSPLLEAVSQNFSLPGWMVGLIGAAPPVCFAVFGSVTPALERRVGLERLTIAAMLVVAIGSAGRAVAPNAIMLLTGTVVIFAAGGVGNVMLPPLVKRYFPDRIGQITALYSTMFAVASLLPPLVAVPVADATTWRFSLGLWAVIAVVAAVPWATMSIRLRRSRSDVVEEQAPLTVGRSWKLPLSWALAVSFAASAAVAYTFLAWLPRILVDVAGVTAAASGVLLSVFAAVGLPLSIVTPLVAVRYPRSVRWLFALAVVAGLVGIAGLAVAPRAATVVWVLLIGVPPLLFPLLFVLISARSRTHQLAVAVSSFTQSVGYAVGALFPLLFGVLQEASGSWTLPLLMLGVMLIAVIPAGVIPIRGSACNN